MNRTARAAAALTTTGLLATALVATAGSAHAAPPGETGGELTWTLTCEGRTVAITSQAAPDVRGHDPLYTPVFSDEHGTFVMIEEGTATATFTDPAGNVIDTFQREGDTTAQGGSGANKGGTNAVWCLAVADSTSVWSDDGSHLRIELPMRMVVAGRR